MNFFKSILRFFGIIKSSGSITIKTTPRDDYSYNELRAKKQNEMNRILEKISDKGIEALTDKEKLFLDKEAQNL